MTPFENRYLWSAQSVSFQTWTHTIFFAPHRTSKPKNVVGVAGRRRRGRAPPTRSVPLLPSARASPRVRGARDRFRGSGARGGGREQGPRRRRPRGGALGGRHDGPLRRRVVDPGQRLETRTGRRGDARAVHGVRAGTQRPPSHGARDEACRSLLPRRARGGRGARGRGGCACAPRRCPRWPGTRTPGTPRPWAWTRPPNC